MTPEQQPIVKEYDVETHKPIERSDDIYALFSTILSTFGAKNNSPESARSHFLTPSIQDILFPQRYLEQLKQRGLGFGQLAIIGSEHKTTMFLPIQHPHGARSIEIYFSKNEQKITVGDETGTAPLETYALPKTVGEAADLVKDILERLADTDAELSKARPRFWRSLIPPKK